jgi:hypothetical protein
MEKGRCWKPSGATSPLLSNVVRKEKANQPHSWEREGLEKQRENENGELVVVIVVLQKNTEKLRQKGRGDKVCYAQRINLPCKYFLKALKICSFTNIGAVSE